MTTIVARSRSEPFKVFPKVLPRYVTGRETKPIEVAELTDQPPFIDHEAVFVEGAPRPDDGFVKVFTITVLSISCGTTLGLFLALGGFSPNGFSFDFWFGLGALIAVLTCGLLGIGWRLYLTTVPWPLIFRRVDQALVVQLGGKPAWASLTELAPNFLVGPLRFRQPRTFWSGFQGSVSEVDAPRWGIWLRLHWKNKQRYVLMDHVESEGAALAGVLEWAASLGKDAERDFGSETPPSVVQLSKPMKYAKYTRTVFPSDTNGP
jgi:hypothetical protein